MTCEVMREQQKGSPVFDFPELGGNEKMEETLRSQWSSGVE